MIVARKNVIGFAVDISLPEKAEVNHEELLQKRITALKLQTTDKKFQTVFSASLREIFGDIPVLQLNSKDLSISVKEQSVSVRIPSTPPSLGREIGKDFPDSKKMAALSADLSLLFAVFLSSLGKPVERVKVDTSVFIACKPATVDLGNTLDKTLLTSLNKLIGINSASGVTLVRRESDERGQFECSIEYHAEKNRVDIVAQTRGSSTTFTVDLEDMIGHAISQVNPILNLLESTANLKTRG